jgi:hypothetical protein
MPKRIRLPYPEGTWFAVPLRTNGFAVGVLARVAGNGPAFGYFFGPKRSHVPELKEVQDLTAKDTILQGMFGDLGLLNGSWPVLGRSETWRRDDWPLPPLVRVDPDGSTAFMSFYSDDLILDREETCDPSCATHFPEDGLWGYGAVEKRLTRLVGEPAGP